MNRIFAIPADAAAMPPKPNSAASKAKTKNVNDHPSISFPPIMSVTAPFALALMRNSGEDLCFSFETCQASLPLPEWASGGEASIAFMNLTRKSIASTRV